MAVEEEDSRYVADRHTLHPRGELGHFDCGTGAEEDESEMWSDCPGSDIDCRLLAVVDNDQDGGRAETCRGCRREIGVGTAAGGLEGRSPQTAGSLLASLTIDLQICST